MIASTVLLGCMIVGISDGDTLTARCEAQADRAAVTLKVRLAEIDAPEKAQPFGTRSRQHLAQLCFGKVATLAPMAASGGLDRYGRTVARVTCAGVDANAEQVRSGMAWVYDRYVIDQSLYVVQDDARATHRGLWADAHPVEPWQWRKLRRQ